MELVNDLENDLALAMLVEKKHSEKVDSKEIVSLLNKVREILEPISEKNDSYSSLTSNANADANSH